MKRSLGADTVVFPTPVWCIGSYDDQGKPNVMTIAWGGICCSKPPCVTVSLRKATYTYGNIMARKAYTVNVPSRRFAKEVDYFGMASGKTVDKFEKTGLTPVASDRVDAPFIAEFPMVLECRLIETLDLGLHTLFIGEIADVKADQRVLTEDDKPDIEKIQPLIFAPQLRKYYATGDYVADAFSVGKSV